MNTEDKDTTKNQPPKHWLSLEQWANDEEFQELAKNEFKSSPWAEGAKKTGEEGWARREFLKLMGASMALTSFGCVRRPAQKIVPYVNRPEEVDPGINNYYTSSYVDGGVGYGLVVTTREGRPIKAEGNPDHPVNKGKMSARAHAHILNLYDPERTSGGLKEGKKVADWTTFDEEIKAALGKGKVAVLTGTVNSPTTKSIIGDFLKSGGKHYRWDALSEEAVRAGQKKAYGKDVHPRFRFDKAKLIVAVDSDFLGTEGNPTEATVQFSSMRDPRSGEMNRLVSFESILSLTGMNADDRYRIRSTQQLDLIMALLRQIVVEKKRSQYAGDSRVKKVLEPFKGEGLGLPENTIADLADELWKNRGESLVIAGRASANAVDVQVAANFLNSVLNNDGRTIDTSKSAANTFNSSTEDLKELIDRINKGEYKTVIINGCNPAYAAPASLGFADALKKVETTIYVGDRKDETGKLCKYIASVSHAMEAWGDAEIQEGVYSIQQPTIRPLNETRSFDEHLLAWSTGDGIYEYVRNVWKNKIQAKNRSGIGSKGFDAFWYEVLQTGVFNTVEKKRDGKSSGRSFKTAALSGLAPTTAGSNYELVLYAKGGLKDGSLANISWLQELPDPVTKVVWDNYVMVSPKTAHDMHIETGSMMKLTANGKTINIPALVQPGMHDKVLGLAVGYGRTAAGSVGNGIGVNAFELAGVEGDFTVNSGIEATLAKGSGKYKLACPQGHHSMEGRQIIVDSPLSAYKKNPEAGIHRHKMINIWSGHKYDGHKWGMNIDLTKCTGCSSCVIACQSENNISNVGKQYVLEGRIMHWIRIDRYYSGSPEDPTAAFMPVACMHCDNAPCETVCPVAATVHTDEGLNDMVYNRCVGTRYCANNCPYKVRRFNWFDYTDVEAPMHLAMNPEVSVRERGVMEKCTFCTHRIKESKRDARVEKREFQDGDVQTACQQSCPAQAITFGDVNDKDSAVSKEMADKRTYSLLEEVNAAPALKYKSKIRNTTKVAADSHGHGGGHH